MNRKKIMSVSLFIIVMCMLLGTAVEGVGAIGGALAGIVLSSLMIIAVALIRLRSNGKG